MPPKGASRSIVQNVTQATTKGEFAPLEKDKFSIEALKYPENVGREDVPHYMLFNIYVPEGDKYAIEKYGTTDAKSRSQSNMDYQNSPENKAGGKRLENGGASNVGVGTVSFVHGGKKFAEGFSGADAGLGGSLVGGVAKGATGVVVAGVGGKAVSEFAEENVKFRPAIKQIKKAVAIYMPDTVMHSYNHNHAETSATDALGNLGLASALGGSIVSGIKAEGVMDALRDLPGMARDIASTDGGKELLGTLSEASGLVGPGFTDLALRSSGKAINPQVELLYKGTANRSFIFEFKFQPRSSQEAATITDIIKTFRMFAAPSISPNSRGRYFIVPAHFDIQFRFGDEENKYIAKISTCVLEAIDVNYAGAGQFATFKDGMPVEIAMQLRFKEAEVIYRELIEEFNY